MCVWEWKKSEKKGEEGHLFRNMKNVLMCAYASDLVEM